MLHGWNGETWGCVHGGGMGSEGGGVWGKDVQGTMYRYGDEESGGRCRMTENNTREANCEAAREKTKGELIKMRDCPDGMSG